MRPLPALRAAPRDARSSATATTTNASSSVASCDGRRAVAQQEPGAVDAGGERVDREVRDRPEVGERLHQRERDAAGDRGPRERQLDAPEHLAAARAERARGLDERRRPLGERGAREQVGVRVEREHEHRRRARQRADVREPVVVAAPAEGLAQRRLHRPGVLQRVGVGVGHHVGRHREREQQRPLEHPAAREAELRDDPAGERPAERDAGADEDDERERVAGVAREHRVGEVRPGRPGAGRDARATPRRAPAAPRARRAAPRPRPARAARRGRRRGRQATRNGHRTIISRIRAAAGRAPRPAAILERRADPPGPVAESSPRHAHPALERRRLLRPRPRATARGARDACRDHRRRARARPQRRLELADARPPADGAARAERLPVRQRHADRLRPSRGHRPARHAARHGDLRHQPRRQHGRRHDLLGHGRRRHRGLPARHPVDRDLDRVEVGEALRDRRRDRRRTCSSATPSGAPGRGSST